MSLNFSFAAERAESEENFKRYVSRLSTCGGAFLSHNLSGDMYAIYSGLERIGFLSLGRGEIEGFFVAPERYGEAESAFAAAIDSLGITSARVLTSDSPLMALCCTRWAKTTAVGLCYEYVGGESEPRQALDCARERDYPALEKSGFFRPDTLDMLMRRHAVYVRREHGDIVAFGACDRVENEPYGFVSVAVREDRRMCGLGKSVFSRIARMLKDYNALALSQCAASDRATAKTLESAGFVCFDKLLKVELK